MSAPDYSLKGDLTNGSIRGHLIRLTVPMIWGLLAIISFQLVDTWYISMLGTEELAAISFTFPVTYILFSLVMAQGIAASSVLSRQLGTGSMSRVRRIATHSLIFAFLSGIVMAVIGLLFMNPLFRAMGADDTMMPIIDDYMTIWFAGSVFLTIPMVGNSAIRATGDTLTPATIMTTAAILNALIAPLLVFGLFGFPRLEVQGAAIATLLANIGASMAAFYVLYAKKRMISRSRLHMKLFGNSIRRLLVIAIPVSIASIIQPATGAFLTGLLASHSTEAVAAFGVASRIEAFVFIMIMALAIGMAPIIGQNWGAGLYGRVHEALSQAIRFCTWWSLGVAAILIAAADPLARMFSDNPDVIALTKLYFWIIPITYAFGNLVQGWSSAFNAMGKPKQSFVMIFVKLIVLTIPTAAIGSHYYGPAGIFAALALVNIVTGIGFHIANNRLCRQYEHSPVPA